MGRGSGKGQRFLGGGSQIFWKGARGKAEGCIFFLHLLKKEALFCGFFYKRRPSSLLRASNESIVQPLKHSIVKRMLVLNGRCRHIFIPKNFYLFWFPSWKFSDLKIIGSNLTFLKILARKKAPKNSKVTFLGKKSVKKIMGMYTIF